MGTPTETGLDGAKLLKLTQWLSPSFPVGAYAYSHGLEWAVAGGDVHDSASAEAWIFDVLARGAGRNDGILLAHAYGAEEMAELERVAELAQAFVVGAERLRETMEMGAALRKGILGVDGRGSLGAFYSPPPPDLPPHRGGETQGEIALEKPLTRRGGTQGFGALYSELGADWAAAYPVVLGVTARGYEMALGAVLSLYLHSFGANLVFAAQRLVPLGQVEGQRIVGRMASLIEGLVPQILAASLDDLGGCAFRSDMASMAHENQKVRLFRT